MPFCDFLEIRVFMNIIKVHNRTMQKACFKPGAHWKVNKVLFTLSKKTCKHKIYIKFKVQEEQLDRPKNDFLS